MSTVYSFISEYNGNNSFLNSLKSGYSKYGKLTPAQLSAAERLITNIREKVKTMAPIEVRKNIEQIMEYKGDNKFVLDLKSKYEKYGKLTEKQIDAGLNVVNRKVQNRLVNPLALPKTETIVVGQRTGRQIKEEKELDFLPIQIDVSHVIGVSRKAVHLRGKLSTVVGSVCRCCGRKLTDELSKLTGMGKTCAKNTKVPYVKNTNDLERFMNDLHTRVNEIGEFDFWIPKSQIIEWKGIHQMVTKTSFKTYIVTS
tara:strand:+ start:1842 stop:2606 length:765 start_codon:yes stop_codon:yes gene_type:complete